MNLGGFPMFLMKRTENAYLRYFSSEYCFNFYANKFRLNYDDKGSISRSGKINHNIRRTEQTAILPYKTPKSLGFEFVRNRIASCETSKWTLKISTNLHGARSYSNIAIRCQRKGQSFITGGGTHNVFYWKNQSHLPEIRS
jgi:anhydro-N-acetylmuramic acid kinase